MNIIERAVLFILTLNMMCTGEGDWSITFNPAEVPAVPGVCALISCSFTHPTGAKPIENIQWKVRNNGGQFKTEIFKRVLNEDKITGTERIKMLEPDLNKTNCSFIMKDIQAEDEREYAFRVEGTGTQRKTYPTTVKIIIQDQPKMEIPALSEGVEANLTCSAPSSCPETPPEIKWWMKTRAENIIDLKNITLTTNEILYLSTFTLTPMSDLHKAAVGCDVSYGNKTISTNTTLEVMYVQTPQIQGEARLKEGETLNLSCSVESHPSTDPVWSFRGNTEKLYNQTSGGHLTIANVGKEHEGIYICEMTYMNKTLNASINIDVFGRTACQMDVNIRMITAFLSGISISALIFSGVLCCQVSCKSKGKKDDMELTNIYTEVILEAV